MAFVISVGILIAVVAKYGLRDADRPRDPAAAQPHTGTQHFGSEHPEHEGGKPSPLQVFASAKVGDWLAYRVVTESSLAPTITATGIESVTAANDTMVTRSFNGRVDATGEVRRDRQDERPRKDLTLDQLTGNDVGGWTIYEVAIADDTHEVGGRTFKCKKISYSSRDPLIPNKRTHTDLWISSEVPVGGLVEERELQDMPEASFVITKQVIGFGTATSTTWGTKPDGL